MHVIKVDNANGFLNLWLLAKMTYIIDDSY